MSSGRPKSWRVVVKIWVSNFFNGNEMVEFRERICEFFTWMI